MGAGPGWGAMGITLGSPRDLSVPSPLTGFTLLGSDPGVVKGSALGSGSEAVTVHEAVGCMALEKPKL